MTGPKPLTVTDVAAVLGVSVDTVLGWVHSGELVATNVATRTGPKARPTYRIAVVDFEAFCGRRRTVGQKPARTPPRRVRVDHVYV